MPKLQYVFLYSTSDATCLEFYLKIDLGGQMMEIANHTFLMRDLI